MLLFGAMNIVRNRSKSTISCCLDPFEREYVTIHHLLIIPKMRYQYQFPTTGKLHLIYEYLVSSFIRHYLHIVREACNIVSSGYANPSFSCHPKPRQNARLRLLAMTDCKGKLRIHRNLKERKPTLVIKS